MGWRGRKAKKGRTSCWRAVGECAQNVRVRVTRYFAALIFLCLLGPAQAEEGVVIFKEGQPLQMVFQGMEKSEADSLGKAFGEVLQKMTGEASTISSLPTEAAAPAASLVLRIVDDPKATDDSYRIRTEEGRVVISARASMGLRFGFYSLMERLGCAFWAFDDEKIPQLPVVRVEPLDESWTPAFRIHDLMNQEAMTMKNDFAHKLRAVSPLKFTGNHNIQPMLRKFADANPKEVFPLVKIRDKATQAITKEVREFNNLHYCYSAPGIGEALAAELEKEVIKRKGNGRDFIYFAGMGDWSGGYCECERCAKIYEEEAWTNPSGRRLPGYSATLLQMINRAAETLEKKYPGIQVGTFAYMSLEAPPAKTVPRGNVSIYVPRLRHSGSTAANDPSGHNHTFWQSLVRWCEIAPGRVDVWEYGVNYSNFLLPYPVIYTMAENIKAYHALGIRGLMIQGNYASLGGDAVMMNNWGWSHLMSDPALDTQKLVEEFTDGYYGPAGPQVREHLKILDAAVKSPGSANMDEFSLALETYLTPEVQKKLAVPIKAGRELVAGPEQEVYRIRLNDLAVGLDAARLWKEGPVKTLKEGDLTAKIWPAKAGTIGPVMPGHVPILLTTTDYALRFAEFEQGKDDHTARLFGEGGVGGWDPATKSINYQEVRLPDSRSLRIDFSDQRVSKVAAASSAYHSIETVYPAKVGFENVGFAYRDKAGAWHEVTSFPLRGKETRLPDVTAWRVTQPRAIVTDEYDFVSAVDGTPVLIADRPHLSGRLGANSDGNIYTVSNFQVDGLSFDEAKPTLSRILKIQEP